MNITHNSSDSCDILFQLGDVFEELYCRYQVEYGLIQLRYDNVSKEKVNELRDRVNSLKRKSDIVINTDNCSWILLPYTFGENLDSFVVRIKAWITPGFSETIEETSNVKISYSDSLKGYGNFKEIIKQVNNGEVPFFRAEDV